MDKNLYWITIKAREIMNKNKAPGFTLIELMIAIVLLAVLASLAAPSFVDALERKRLVGAAESFYSGIQFARSEAIKQNRTVYFQFISDINTDGTNDDWCYGIDDDWDHDADPEVSLATTCDCTTPSTCTIYGQQKVITADNFSNITMTAVDGTITFDGMNGFPIPNRGTFTLSSPGATPDKVVTLNSVGRVKMD